jgi:hypothetical protein
LRQEAESQRARFIYADLDQMTGLEAWPLQPLAGYPNPGRDLATPKVADAFDCQGARFHALVSLSGWPV